MATTSPRSSAAGRLRLVPSDLSHDIDRLAGFELFTAVNSALEVGLDGAVNVEVLDGRPVAGIGGHADFCAAAARSDGGLSIVALPATRRGRSTIVAGRGEGVDTRPATCTWW